MRRATTFILAASFILLLAAGAMAWGGGMGGGYGGGWGGHMMAPGYHMYQGNGYGPGYQGQGQGYGPANCPGWNAYQGGNQGRGYYGPNQGQAPNQGYGRSYRQAPATPPADNLER